MLVFAQERFICEIGAVGSRDAYVPGHRPPTECVHRNGQGHIGRVQIDLVDWLGDVQVKCQRRVLRADGNEHCLARGSLCGIHQVGGEPVREKALLLRPLDRRGRGRGTQRFLQGQGHIFHAAENHDFGELKCVVIYIGGGRQAGGFDLDPGRLDGLERYRQRGNARQQMILRGKRGHHMNGVRGSRQNSKGNGEAT